MSNEKIKFPLPGLGLGAAQIGNLYREVPDEIAEQTVITAWEQGIRYFDTAPHYGLGLSERRLGKALKNLPRDEYIVSTKVGRLLVPSPETAVMKDEQGFDVQASTKRVWDFSRDGILRSVEASLERLDLERIDILYLHDPENHFEQASTEGISALIELREQGIVQAVGAGMNFAAPLAELIRRADVDLVMCAGRFSLLDSEAVEELLPLALSRNVGVVAAGVYNSGLLSSARPSVGANFNYEPASDELLAKANLFADVCEEYGLELPDLAVGYVRENPAVSSVVLGARTPEQVISNVEHFEAKIPQEMWDDLYELKLIPKAAS
jgi:D-threo-aldose 1-dehydrogenase